MSDHGPELEVLSGDLAGKTYQVDEAEFVIGRAPNCHLVLPKRYISREHARILRDEDDQFVVDSLSHKNPVRVKDRPVREHVLADGDEFEMCGIRFRFRRAGAGARPRRHAVVTMPGSQPVRGDDPTPDPDAPAGRGGGSGFQDDDDPSDSYQTAARRSARDLDPPTPDPDAPSPARASTSPARRSAPAADKVVFEVDEKESSDEQTAAVSVPSGSKRSGEDARERTAELGKVGDPDDPDYDPFAEVLPSKGKHKGSDPSRERQLRLLTWVGLLAIAGAGIVLWQISQPEEWKLQNYGQPVTVRLDEAVLFTVDWTPDDPPRGRGATLTSGEAELFWNDPLINVEWLCPHVDARSTFMVMGKDPGQTQMELVFDKSRRKVYVDIEVLGESVHEGGRDARRARLAKEHPDLSVLHDLSEEHTAIAEGFKQERTVPGKEANYRRALVEFALATDYAMAARQLIVASSGGVVPQEETIRITQCEERESQARTDYEDFARRQVALYRDALNSPEFGVKVTALKRALRAISHECDPDFQRLKLLLREWLKTPYESDGVEKCDLR